MISSSWRSCAWVFAGALLGCSGAHQHGSMSSMSIASERDWEACEHQVPAEVCVRCHPERIASYKQRGDWCPEHDVPESQCLECHPDLDFSPAEEPPGEADVAVLSQDGADVATLEPHRVIGKFTVFDFRADWCPPCRKVDEHLFAKLETRNDIAVRKLDVASWESPIAERWLRDVPELPYLVVFGPDGRRLGDIAGAKLEELDALLEPRSP
jgi:thiol-disulfide isomerase/thioredoxin